MNDRIDRILVADDDDMIREVLKIKLEKSGYTVLLAEDGLTTLAGVETEFPDLLILDVKMPDLDGLEVCRRLRSAEITQALPILMLTAYGGVEHVLAGLDAGADDYVVKPFHPEEVLMRVRSLLRMKQIERDLREKEVRLARVEAVGQLLVTLAHHINNSLAVLMGRAQATKTEDVYALKLKEVCMRQSERITVVLKSLEEQVGRLQLEAVPYAGSDLKMLDVEMEITKRLENAGGNETIQTQKIGS
jgi:DNA-binding response OmpR family regulator